MQQRQLRLGDILDDYCPRERRLTNHAIVAMVGEEIKQTRCTTCDAEHPYKGGRVPPKRKTKSAPASLYEQVLTSVTASEGSVGEAPTLVPPGSAAPQPTPPTVDAVEASGSEGETHAGEPVAEPAPEEVVRVHRPLIRATLPRVEGQPLARPVPEFTVRQPGGRHGRFEGHGGGGGGRHQDRHKVRGPSDHGVGMRGPGPRPGSHRAARPGHPAHHPVGSRPGQHPQHPSRRPPGHGRTGKKPSK
jgi:hypothetical protein